MCSQNGSIRRSAVESDGDRAGPARHGAPKPAAAARDAPLVGSAPRPTRARARVARRNRARRSSLKAVEEFEIGVQPPAGFFDPLNYCEDQPESFVRRRAVERKHGRVTMVAFVGILVHNANIEFPGYLSKSQGLKFSDIPNGIYGLSKVPSAGLLQILLFFGLVELAWWPASNYSGDYGVGFFGAKYEGEEKLQKLNAEMANGRLAMLGVAGAMLAEGQTGETLSEQLLALNFNPFA